MKLNNKTYKLCIAAVILLAACLAVFRFVLLSESKYINELGLYNDAGMGNLFNALTFILIAISVIFVIPLMKSTFTLPQKESAFVRYSSLFCALMMIMLTISSAGKLFDKFDILHAIELVFCAASTVYFAGLFLKGTAVKVSISGMFALVPALYLAFRAIRMFMDINTQINASQRSFTLLFIVMAMMFFVSETEYSVPLGKREKTVDAVSKRTAKYALLGIITSQLAFVFPLTYTFALVFPARDFNGIAYGISDVIIGVYVLSRVLSVKEADKE